jgi:hypothetical protein
VLKRTVFPAFAAFNPVALYEPLQFGGIRSLPPVPVLPETLLLLDIEAQERCVDLRRISQIVLSDLGATLQILRLAGREWSDLEGPARIEDCIADLGVRPCLDAMPAQVTSLDTRYAAVTRLWNHSRVIAQNARFIAEEMPDVNPDRAYLAGLLHEIGSLPAALGWRESEFGESSDAALRLVHQWSLPPVVSELFGEQSLDGISNSWPEIVRMAHRFSVQSTLHCVYKQEIYPMLYAEAQSVCS